MDESVDRAKALRLICPLPDGTVTGVQQLARRGDMVIVATLSPTIRQDTWNGLTVRIVAPTVGEVAANWFGFTDHHLFDETHHPPAARDGELTRYNQTQLLQPARIRAVRLRDAVEAYTAAFAPPAAPEFVAAAHLPSLLALAARLDHAGSAHPNTLAGKALQHAQRLREAASAIHLDLLPLTGERRAADSAPRGLSSSLPQLRRLRRGLLDLATLAEDAGRTVAAAQFRDHAGTLAGIDHELTADLERPRAGRVEHLSEDQARIETLAARERAAARRTVPSAASVQGPEAPPAPQGVVPAPESGRGRP